ncbi:MAG: hypothetical protein HC890_10400 [Chloroflexaceae bacterium]|nr:hypothetical protein [Chloroflexaceae bacterium]
MPRKSLDYCRRDDRSCDRHIFRSIRGLAIQINATWHGGQPEQRFLGYFRLGDRSFPVN